MAMDDGGGEIRVEGRIRRRLVAVARSGRDRGKDAPVGDGDDLPVVGDPERRRCSWSPAGGRPGHGHRDFGRQAEVDEGGWSDQSGVGAWGSGSVGLGTCPSLLIRADRDPNSATIYIYIYIYILSYDLLC